VASPGALFFYIKRGTTPTLVLLRDPDSRQPFDYTQGKPFGRMPLASPPGCRFWSLTPAPLGPWMALEWQCDTGSLTQLVNVDSQKISFLVDDPTVDSHFLAWNPDGKNLYLKLGAFSNPQIVRVEAGSRRTTVLPLSPNTYNLTVSPADGSILWALTGGIGSGSQLWASAADGSSSRMLLSDADNILGLMRYSPDGKHIAAIRLPDGQSDLPPGELWVADSDGTSVHLTTGADAGRGMFPVWSPNGEKIAYIGRTQPNDPSSINLSVLSLLNLKLSTLNFQLTAPPVWSPDGSGLYFTLASDGKMGLWFYEFSTGKTQKLFDDACCAGWISGGHK
jgi:WD40 repeat protein